MTIPYWEIPAAVLGVITLFAAVMTAMRKGSQDSLKAAVEAQEATIAALQGRVDELERQVAEGRVDLKEVRMESAARRTALLEILMAISESQLCLNAPGCPRRVPPGQDLQGEGRVL